MSYTKAGDAVAIQFTTSNPTTGALSNADSLPTGTLVRNGDNTAESVTVSNVATGVYKAAVTIPSGYAAADVVQLRIAATVGGVAGGGIVWGTVLRDVPAAVWSNATRTLTQGAASVAAAVSGASISVYRGTTWIIALTGLGDISAYDTIYFSVKMSTSRSDDQAELRVKNAASGLERIAGSAPTSAANGTITIDDAVAGDITITVQEEETVSVSPCSGLYYDIKGIDNDGNVDVISFGDRAFSVVGEITRKIA